MDLLILLVVLTIVAILAYYITEQIPDPRLKTIIQLLVLLILVIAFLSRTGLMTNVLR